jgi:hypothetical protein
MLGAASEGSIPPHSSLAQPCEDAELAIMPYHIVGLLLPLLCGLQDAATAKQHTT